MPDIRFRAARVAALFAAAAFISPFLAPVYAQAPKVGVIDTQRILSESAPGKKALAELRTLQEQKENEAKGLQQEITDLQNRLAEGRLSLSEEKIAELQQQLEQKVTSARRFQEDAAREVERKRNQVLETIEVSVMPVINRVGKENGFTLIFRKFESGLIYMDDTVDITNQVIQMLDAGAAGQGQ